MTEARAAIDYMNRRMRCIQEKIQEMEEKNDR